MPDITMCKGEGCSLKKTCYRHKAKPTLGWQSYFTKSPVRDDECFYYWLTNKVRRNHFDLSLFIPVVIV